MRTAQEKRIGQERRTTMVTLMGPAMPSLNITIKLTGLAMGKTVLPQIFQFFHKFFSRFFFSDPFPITKWFSILFISTSSNYFFVIL
jgi:hypothetical protein